jgi:hypothetical protein
VIRTWPTSRDITAPENAVRTNPIPGLKTDPLKNPIATQKKRHFVFYTRPRDLFLKTCLDRSSQDKNFLNTHGRYWQNPTDNGRQNCPPVTTSHVFWPNEHRKTASLLPIWLPNPTVLALNCPRPLRFRARGSRDYIKSKTYDLVKYSERAKRGGGGGQARASCESPSIEKRTRKFYSYWFPARFLLLSKKIELRTAAQFQAVYSGSFT